MNTIHDENKINSILIDLTDITGFDHTSEALEAFHKAESLVKEYAEHIREKTIDECIACVPEEQHLFYDCGYSNERGHNTCREQTITNLTKLKSNEKTN